MISFYRILPCLAVVAGLAFAQGPRAGAMGPAGGAHAPQSSTLSMTSLQTVTGSVTAVSIGYGMQYPSITINKVQIKVAPVWYLLENNFEIKTGDSLSVVAASSLTPGDPYLYAVELTNTAT